MMVLPTWYFVFGSRKVRLCALIALERVVDLILTHRHQLDNQAFL
jgi:hypothetical protein